MTANSVLIAQLTDTHLFADAEGVMMGVKTAESLNTVVAELARLPRTPDLLLLTGDLTQDETAASYERLRHVIEPLGILTAMIPGNHDVPAVMISSLQGGCFTAARSLQIGGWQVVLLDSVVAGQTAGALAASELRFLADQLASFPNTPTLVALHHPPCLIGSPWMDEIGLQQAGALFEVLDRSPQVKLVIFGHIHQAFEGDRQGVRYLGTPSACMQFKPRSQDLTLDETLPGFRLIELFADGMFHTEVKRVPHTAASLLQSMI